MLTALEALERFFDELGPTAWRMGELPDQAAFPCLVWTPLLPAPYETETAEAQAWFRGEAAQAQRWAFLRQLENALPAGGRKLLAGRGCLLLRRGSPFVRFLSERELLGLSLKLTVRDCGASPARPAIHRP